MRSSQKTELENVLVRQIERLDRRLAGLQATSSRYSWSRLAIVLGGFAVAWAGFTVLGDVPGALLLLAAVVAFGVAAFLHGRVEKSIRRHRLWRGCSSLPGP